MSNSNSNNILKAVKYELLYNKRAAIWSLGVISFMLLICAVAFKTGKNAYINNPFVFLAASIGAGSFRKFYFNENGVTRALRTSMSKKQSLISFLIIQYFYSFVTYFSMTAIIMIFAGFINLEYILSYFSFFLFTVIMDISSNLNIINYLKENEKKLYWFVNTTLIFGGIGFFYYLANNFLVGESIFSIKVSLMIISVQFLILFIQFKINYKYYFKIDLSKNNPVIDLNILKNGLR